MSEMAFGTVPKASIKVLLADGVTDLAGLRTRVLTDEGGNGICFTTFERLSLGVQHDNLDDILVEATRAKFIIGHMNKPDEDGVCRGVLIATGRIQCVIEA